MQTYVNDWFRLQLQADTWVVDRLAWSFAVRASAKSTILANLVNLGLHLVMEEAGLLPFPLSEALTVSVLVTTAITLTISLLIFWLVANAIIALSVSRDEFARLSSIDALSGLINRRVFLEKLSQSRCPAALAILDIDRFKLINDTYGHVMGDEVIKAIGDRLTQELEKPGIVVARLGGEEFGVLIETADGRSPEFVVQGMRLAIASLQIEGLPGSVTVSGGVADMVPGRAMMEAYKAADRALYVAKACGRNCIIHERDVPDPLSRPEASDIRPPIRRQA